LLPEEEKPENKAQAAIQKKLEQDVMMKKE
jgi:hypothetical protein